MRNLRDRPRGASPSVPSIPWVTMVCVVAMFLLAGVDLDFALQMEDMSWREDLAERIDDGNLKRRIVFLVFAIYAAVGLRPSGRFPIRPQGAAGRFMLAFVGLALLSVLWSDDPGLTVKRLFVFFSLSAAALVYASRSSPRATVLLACLGGAAILSMGFAAELGLGTFTPWYSDYRFAGTQHPNATGLVAGIFVLGCLVSADVHRGWMRLFQLGTILGIAALVLTKSRTAFVAFLVASFVYKNMVSNASKRAQYVIGFGILFLIMLVFFGNSVFPAIQEGILLGRAEEGVSTLAGRIGIWIECVSYIGERPVIGYGFDSFWTSDRIAEISFSQGWNISSSHSVYLEYALSLGLLGLIFFIGFMWASVLRSSTLARSSDDPGRSFELALLVFFVTYGVLDTMAIAPGFPMFLILLCLTEIGFVARAPRNTGRADDLGALKRRLNEEQEYFS